MENYSSINRFRCAVFNHGEYQHIQATAGLLWFAALMLVCCRGWRIGPEPTEFRGHLAWGYRITAVRDVARVASLRIVPFNRLTDAFLPSAL